MELIDEIVEARNFWEAWMSVKRNHGAAGVDKMPTEELDVYLPLSKPFDNGSYQKKNIIKSTTIKTID